MENIWIELATKNRKNHKLGVIYNPLRKHTNNLESLNMAIDRCKTENKNITIMGDFNITYLAPTEQMNTNSVLTPYNLHPANTKQPTRISRTTSPLLYIINDKLINSQYITDNLLSSYHLGQFAILDDVLTMKHTVKIKVTYDKKHYNVSQFNHDLIRADCNQIFSTKTVNQQLNISRIFCKILQKHAPGKTAFVRNTTNFETKNESWFDEGCRAALDEKQEAHRE